MGIEFYGKQNQSRTNEENTVNQEIEGPAMNEKKSIKAINLRDPKTAGKNKRTIEKNNDLKSQQGDTFNLPPKPKTRQGTRRCKALNINIDLFRNRHASKKTLNS